MDSATSSHLRAEAADPGFAAVLDAVLQHIWVVFGVFAIVTGLSVAYAIFATPIYRADALIQVEDNKSTTLSGVQDIANALGATTSPVSGEIEILRSREVVMKAVNATHADIRVEPNYFPILGRWIARRHPVSDGVASPMMGFNSYAWGGELIRVDEFSVPESYLEHRFSIVKLEGDRYLLRDDGGREVLQGQVGKKTSFNLGAEPAQLSIATLSANAGTVFYLTKVSPIRAYRDILARLEVVETSKQSSIIRLSYESNDVNQAQLLVNAIAKAYLTQNVERRSAEADQSLKFLAEQLPEIKRGVERAEDALNAFRTKTNTVSVEKSTETLLNQAVEIEKRRLTLQLKRDELRQRFKPDHPELKAIEAQLEASAQEAGKVNSLVNRLPAAQRDLLRLQRDAEVSNQLYIALLNNVQQLKVAKAGTIGNVRIIDFAVRDTNPVAPRKTLVVLLGVILGALLGLLSAFIVRVLRPTVREASEVERATGLVSYASVPESASQEKLDSSLRDRKGRRSIVEGRNQLLAVLQPDDPAIESLRSLRTGLAFALMGAPDKNIVITGATAGLGKSFISANLSVLLAATGKRVLLVETDMRRPQLGTYFGYSHREGLSDVLAGRKALEDVVLKDAATLSNIDVLPSGQIPPNPGELLLNERFAELVRNVQDQYDHIIFDSAPVLPVGDTLAVARCASTVFLVVRAETSTVAEVRDATRKLQAAGIAVKGIIFNGVKRRRVGYGYAYKYYYGYASK